MSNTIVTPVPAVSAQDVLSLDRALDDLIGQGRKTKEVLQTYADQLVGVVGKEWWLLKGKAKQPVKAIRERFAAKHLEAGFKKTYIDVMWQRVKEASGYVTAGNRVKGATDPDSKNLDDLRTILNRIFKAEEDGGESAWSDEKAVLMDVYDRMGGDTDRLG